MSDPYSDDTSPDDVPEYRLANEVKEVAKELSAESLRVEEWRGRNRAAYNARQRELMRARRLYEKTNKKLPGEEGRDHAEDH